MRGDLRSSNPKLDTLLVSSMVGMCGQMIAVAALFLAIVWFPFRRGQRWALWALQLTALCCEAAVPPRVSEELYQSLARVLHHVMGRLARGA